MKSATNQLIIRLVQQSAILISEAISGLNELTSRVRSLLRATRDWSLCGYSESSLPISIRVTSLYLMVRLGWFDRVLSAGMILVTLIIIGDSSWLCP